MTCIEDTVLDLVDLSRTRARAVHWIMLGCQARLTTPDRLLYSMGRRRRIRHRRLVKDVCADVSTGAQTPLERRYLRHVERAHALPTGRRQQHERIAGGRVFRDVDYEAYRTLVELDGRLGHEGEDNAFRDRRRDNASTVGGRTTLRFGWTDVSDSPCEVASQVIAVLRRQGWTGRPSRCSATCPLAAG
jgi:very-short-patch-repair endonuclease